MPSGFVNYITDLIARYQLLFNDAVNRKDYVLANDYERIINDLKSKLHVKPVPNTV